MSLAALSSAAIIALASTLIFFLVVKSWDALATTIDRPNAFCSGIMFEAAQRFRDEIERLGRQQSHYLVAAAVCITVFAVAYLLPAGLIFGDLPQWQLIVGLLLFVAAVFYAGYRLAHIFNRKRRLRFVRDANMATGHALQKLTANRNRVFHDVSCGSQVIDNVLVGLHGIYTISVIARPPGKDNRVRLKRDELTFGDGQGKISVARCGAKSIQLENEIGRLINHPVRVRSVIALPGWEIDSQASNDYLLVNERTLPVLTGWKDDKDYLMNEDVEKIHEMLTKRCSRGR